LCSGLYRRRFDANTDHDLFLLEDLEDAGKTSELAESDLDALHAVADWINS
jgi:hypothetical protein